VTNPTPAAETTINTDLVHALLVDQYPELADQPIEFTSSGWDNEIHRIGDHHAIRLPRRTLAAELVEHEQRWLPELAPHLPLPVPTPVHNGHPAIGYPWHWSVVPWLPGVPLAHSPSLDTTTLAIDLARFLNALHRPAPADAPRNPYRGVPLPDRDATVRKNAAEVEGVDAGRALELWAQLVETPPWGEEPLWLHGDLHPLNLLVHGGRLSAVIDWGDITAGDPAADLAVAWMAFDSDDRLRFRDSLELNGHRVGVHTWNRARAWALSLGLAFVAHSSDNPALRRIGATTLDRVLG
jgi:aminoglycoside phosphotransferase (APT) family kinase protein